MGMTGAFKKQVAKLDDKVHSAPAGGTKTNGATTSLFGAVDIAINGSANSGSPLDVLTGGFSCSNGACLKFDNGGVTNFIASGAASQTPQGVMTKIASVGPVSGLGGVTTIPASYTLSALAVVGNGYVGKLDDGSYVRFYVKSWVLNAGNGIIGVNIQYQYPYYSPGKIIYTTAYGNTFAYTFVPVSNSVTVQVWGAGGGGGGGGCGGGGGGGYGSQTISVTPGVSYPVVVGSGGANGLPSETDGTSGGTSSFGTTLISATGGHGGASSGTGGAGGISTATTNSSGATGSNNSVGGGGGGDGGAGGGPGGGAGATYSTAAGAPGGGGAGGTWANGSGAEGRVIITW